MQDVSLASRRKEEEVRAAAAGGSGRRPESAAGEDGHEIEAEPPPSTAPRGATEPRAPVYGPLPGGPAPGSPRHRVLRPRAGSWSTGCGTWIDLTLQSLATSRDSSGGLWTAPEAH
ncbi:hypothetical protein ACRRTK_018156 [Alexandromys fortis]